MSEHLTTPQEIAKAIKANCDAYAGGRVDRETWSKEQNRFWRVAAEGAMASAVMRLVCPSILEPSHVF